GRLLRDAGNQNGFWRARAKSRGKLDQGGNRSHARRCGRRRNGDLRQSDPDEYGATNDQLRKTRSPLRFGLRSECSAGNDRECGREQQLWFRWSQRLARGQKTSRLAISPQ